MEICCFDLEIRVIMLPRNIKQRRQAQFRVPTVHILSIMAMFRIQTLTGHGLAALEGGGAKNRLIIDLRIRMILIFW